MKKIWSFFNKNKSDGKKNRIKIQISEHSKEFFLEDQSENRTLKQILKSIGYEQNQVIAKFVHKNNVLGRRYVQDFEILSFISQQEEEKGNAVEYYFHDLRPSMIRRSSFPKLSKRKSSYFTSIER